jgi:hypothetical protein
MLFRRPIIAPVLRAITCAAKMPVCVALGIAVVVQADMARANPPPLDVLVLGDSQITFGSGPVLLSFFEMLDKSCQEDWPAGYRSGFAAAPQVGIIGVRSTSLQAWVSRSDRGKGAICDVDPKWHVNAGSYGALNHNENPYIQIGQGDDYAFCKDGQSAFEAMFAERYYAPRLLVMSFLGNEAERWANDPQAALEDVQSTMAQLPDDLPCIFMTTTPVYRQETATLRSKAQDHILAAFEQSGSRCSIVAGHTPDTIAMNVGNAAHFRRSASGAVRDPFHPTRTAQTEAVMTLTGAICAAVAEQLSPGRQPRADAATTIPFP